MGNDKTDHGQEVGGWVREEEGGKDLRGWWVAIVNVEGTKKQAGIGGERRTKQQDKGIHE